jgi:hypothetical protein
MYMWVRFLPVVDRLALAGHDPCDLHEPGYLVRAAGDRDHSAVVGMSHEHDGPSSWSINGSV